MKLRAFPIASAALVACSPADAASKRMTIHFVGDWCFSSRDGKSTAYTLPSWTEGGHCTKILSINEHGFYGEGRNCDPEKIRLSKEVARSGVAYTAVVTARCQPDGPVIKGTLHVFEFTRYKGNLDVIEK